MASDMGSSPLFHERNPFSSAAAELSVSQLLISNHATELKTLKTHPLASPTVMEGGSQRRHLAAWLQHMIGPLNLPYDPSEEDLWLALQDGSVLCKLLNKVNQGITAPHKEKCRDSSSPSHNNVEMFLSAAADMKLPLFEVSDLDKGCYSSSSCKRILDCLLSFKCYYEKNQSKEMPSDSFALFSSSGQRASAPHLDSAVNLNGHSGIGTLKSPHQPRKRWVIPDYDSTYYESNMPIVADSTLCIGQMTSTALHTNSLPKSSGHLTDENRAPSHDQPRTGIDLHQMTQKVRDILDFKAMQDSALTEHSSVLSSLENISPQSLSAFVTAVFGDKQHLESAGLVEYMLKKVLEELERRFVSKNVQVAKLKCMLKEHLDREEKLASRARLLETLAAGAGEEVKILSSQLQKMKYDQIKAEEDKKTKEAVMENLLEEGRRCRSSIENLKQELVHVQQTDQEHFKRLELEKNELEQSLKANLNEREALLEQSKRKVQELEAVIALEMEAIKKKNEEYGSFVLLQLQLLRDVKWVLHSMKQEVLRLRYGCQEDLENLEEQLCGLVHAAVGYHKVLAENRLLYNEVQDLKGNIRVYCRVRPFLPGQPTKHSTVEFVGENGDILISNPLKQQGKDAHKMFSFNKVFQASATQEQVFMDTRPLIRSVLDGFNVCIFAYGQTGSGKTYTMSGPGSLSEKDWGVNYRALDDLFKISRSRKDVISYEVGVQMIEIYNEQVRDLLFIDNSNRRLEIRNNSQLNGVNVPDASMLPVNSTSDVFKLMKIGQKNRATGATALNERSSRSHSVLTVHVRGLELASGTLLHGCLHLVDLAGSERVDRSEASGDRLKEAQHINRSLSALGDVVSALAQKSGHVPYRNSKLTQLLQDSLGGQAKTLMFVHISPDLESYGETLSTLKFAERVASVELGAARSNKESRELRDLKEQVALLREVVSKKDLEIERLQVNKGSRNDSKTGLKARTSPGFLFQDSLAETQDQKFRRQTIDSRGHKEKQLVEKLYQGRPQEAFKGALFSVPLAGSKHSGGNEVVRMVTLTNRLNDLDTSTGGELEALSKEMRDSIQDPFFHATASADDLSYTTHSLHGEQPGTGEHSAPVSVINYPQYRSVMEKDRYEQAMSLRESLFEKPCDILSGTEPRRGSFISNIMRNKINGDHDRFSDKEAEYSDGDTSQAGSEANTADEKKILRK